MHLHHLDTVTSRHIQRGARILISRGTATATEALLEIARRIGGLAAIVAVLNEIEARPKPPRRRRQVRPSPRGSRMIPASPGHPMPDGEVTFIDAELLQRGGSA